MLSWEGCGGAEGERGWWCWEGKDLAVLRGEGREDAKGWRSRC